MIFDEIRGHLLILLLYSAQTKASDEFVLKNAVKFALEALHTLNFHRVCLI